MSNEAAPASSLTDKEREAIAQMPYEEARDKLIQAVQALEAGGLNLDQSMRQWEIGEALAKRAQSLLGEVRAKLVHIVCTMVTRCLSSSVDRALLS